MHLLEDASRILESNLRAVSETADARAAFHSLGDALCSCDAGFEPICSYLASFPHAQHKPALVLIVAIELQRRHGLPLFMVSHEEKHEISGSASQHLIDSLRNEFPAEYRSVRTPAVIKTITLSVLVEARHRHFLVTQIGDQRISYDEMLRISEATGISMHRLRKHSTINMDFDPVTHFGREPGMVGPFPDHVADIEALIYLRGEEHSLVALRYTPTDTVFLDRNLFDAILFAYNGAVGLPCYLLQADPECSDGSLLLSTDSV